MKNQINNKGNVGNLPQVLRNGSRSTITGGLSWVPYGGVNRDERITNCEKPKNPSGQEKVKVKHHAHVENFNVAFHESSPPWQLPNVLVVGHLDPVVASIRTSGIGRVEPSEFDWRLLNLAVLSNGIIGWSSEHYLGFP